MGWAQDLLRSALLEGVEPDVQKDGDPSGQEQDSPEGEASEEVRDDGSGERSEESGSEEGKEKSEGPGGEEDEAGDEGEGEDEKGPRGEKEDSQGEESPEDSSQGESEEEGIEEAIKRLERGRSGDGPLPQKDDHRVGNRTFSNRNGEVIHSTLSDDQAIRRAGEMNQKDRIPYIKDLLRFYGERKILSQAQWYYIHEYALGKRKARPSRFPKKRF